MVSRDAVALFMEQMPDDEVRALRDSIAGAEGELAAPIWERQRALQGRVKDLKARCETAEHSLTIVLAGAPGRRRRLMRDRRNERRSCIMCGTEEVGTLATGFLRRFLFRRAVWKFEKLKRPAARTFTDREWYFETCSIVRNLSFSTDVILQHAFPPRVPNYE
jgi:hypothetical protein